ncbi:hypothetical protein PM082_008654 [Marasmius tenuissimus]|nr:hypothetical protein PM082_008654 [Marasmius tenuissimus]
MSNNSAIDAESPMDSEHAPSSDGKLSDNTNLHHGDNPFSHIQFSDRPRRFPGEANDDLPPSSPPLSHSSFEEEKECQYVPDADTESLKNLGCARVNAEQALLKSRTDLEYFERSRKLHNVQDMTIRFLEGRIYSWESVYIPNTKARVKLYILEYNYLCFTIENLKELNDTQDTLHNHQEEVSELTAQVDSLTEENKELRTRANALEIESDDLKCFEAVSSVGGSEKPSQKNGRQLSKQARYRASHRDELREKARIRRNNIKLQLQSKRSRNRNKQDLKRMKRK